MSISPKQTEFMQISDHVHKAEENGANLTSLQDSAWIKVSDMADKDNPAYKNSSDAMKDKVFMLGLKLLKSLDKHLTAEGKQFWRAAGQIQAVRKEA